MQPFSGIRILDFTQVFAGPFGCYQLALLGADVVKIERPGGDDMRRGPPNKEWAARNLGTGFMGINSNKRCLVLDLTKPKAIEIVLRRRQGRW
jgi:crotonobetainyl-CoA:carnitine CoA-transferase CaiB-like acyl-CoA transferase